MPKVVIANFSPHPIGQNRANVQALDEQFGRGNWSVVGSLPVLPDIGNFKTVKAVVQLWVVAMLDARPTHIHISCNSIFHGLIYQAIEAYPELQVPRIMWDAKREKWWPAPPPMSRQDRMDIETKSLDIPPELSRWAVALMTGGR